MGCGESKHDVAVGNTVDTRRAPTVWRKTLGKNTKETIPPMTPADGEETPTVVDSGKKPTSPDLTVKESMVEDVKDSTAVDEKAVEEVKSGALDVNGGEVEDEGFIAAESPNKFFSSREELMNDGGASEKSLYFSPTHGNKKSEDSIAGTDEEKTPEIQNGMESNEEINAVKDDTKSEDKNSESNDLALNDKGNDSI